MTGLRVSGSVAEDTRKWFWDELRHLPGQRITMEDLRTVRHASFLSDRLTALLNTVVTVCLSHRARSAFKHRRENESTGKKKTQIEMQNDLLGMYRRFRETCHLPNEGSCHQNTEGRLLSSGLPPREPRITLSCLI
jgi:hypothetical protein